jgi:hypothetical protein
MQISGGHLLTAGLDGGDTIIFFPRGKKMQIEPGHRHHESRNPIGMAAFMI